MTLENMKITVLHHVIFATDISMCCHDDNKNEFRHDSLEANWMNI